MKTTWMLAAALTAALAIPLTAQAAGTAPLPNAQQTQQSGEKRLEPFGENRSYLGVAASSAWLYQAKLGNRLLDLRLYTPDGEQTTFQEDLGAADDGGIRLALRASVRGDSLLLQMDQDAVDTLEQLDITQIVVTDTDMIVKAEYLTQDLSDMRSLFALGERELLCVSGEDDPVTVVSEDGVRRQITE